MKNCLLIFLFLACVFGGCVPILPKTPFPASGTYQVPTDIRFRLTQRDFLLHVPPGITSKKPLPLLVVLHGAFSTAQQTEQETGFSELADQETFLVAYPEGIGIFGLLQHWNAGHCCGKAAEDNIDDVAFVAEVIAMINGRMPVDPQRIYMAGMSNGGMLTYRYAAERGHELAAIAIVSGALGSRNGDQHPNWTIPAPSHPPPVIAFHGIDDGHIPIEGGRSPLKGGKRSFQSFADAMEFWRSVNACGSTPQIKNERAGSVKSFLWADCNDGHRIEFYSLEDWAHRWPAPYFTARLPDDDKLKNFDATERIWQFLSEFRRYQH